MIRFEILTIFPQMFAPYWSESIIGRAIAAKKIKAETIDIRMFTRDAHRSVDDKPYGGGAGMLMKVEPIYKAVKSAQRKAKNKKTRVILFSAKGKQFTQRDAARLAQYDTLIMICGRYEGVDERVATHIADEEISVGPYVLSGGELPALIVLDAVSRLVPGVLGNVESLKEESFSFTAASHHAVSGGAQSGGRSQKPAGQTGEYPQYTRPEVFYPDPKNKKAAWRVPKVLLGGNHAKIREWRSRKQSK